jgi:glycosyltransferase involved in cell wall biosynthesis
LETYLQEALFVLFLFCLTVQIYFLVYKQKILAAYIPSDNLPKVRIPISVIISARNEAKNLKENLPAVLQQDYPYYEVIVVNDCSYDGSEKVLSELQEIYKQLRVVTITEHDRFKTGKKFALTLGIKAAKNEYLLFTDADCQPASVHWITRMAANFSDKKTEIIIGYSPYKRTRNILNPFIRFETIKTAINYLSAALKNNAYMGVGRNLAYTKTLFFSSKGFAAHMHVLAGDDDLFVNKNATEYNTVVEMHPDSFTYTDAKTSLGGWFRQKKRHFGVGKYYKKRHKRMLSLDALSGFLFYVLLILCIVFNFEPLLAIGLFLIRLIIQLAIYAKLFRKLDGKYLVWYLPVFDMLYYFYLNTFGILGTFIKTTQWK